MCVSIVMGLGGDVGSVWRVIPCDWIANQQTILTNRLSTRAGVCGLAILRSRGPMPSAVAENSKASTLTFVFVPA